jgi:hypothetical protein
LLNAIEVICEHNKGVIMTTSSSAQDPGRMQVLELPPNRAQRLSRGGIRSFAGEQISAKLYSVGIRAALTALLSIFGLGSAMGQSIDQDMELGANTQASRDRVIAEIQQARADGTIKRWSPVLLEVPFKTPRKGIRFAPLSTHQPEGSAVARVPGDSSAPVADLTSALPATAE